jgi:hypothetical protein
MSLRTLKNITVGTPIRRKGLTIFPLSATGGRPSNAKLADDTLIVSELETAHVPELQVHNPGTVPMIIPAGRVLEGGRQTRTVNVSILVPAGATIVIPVSCVEAGRWHGGRMFRDSKRVTSREVRRTLSRGVKQNLDATGRKGSDQGAVWASIDHELHLRRINHDSSLYLSAYDHFEQNAEMRALTDELISRGAEPGQTGIAIAHGDKVIGIEVFASEDDLRASWEALVRSALLDMAVAEDTEATATDTDVQRFIGAFADSGATTAKGTGVGTEYHVAEPTLVGQALVDDSGELMHAFAYAEA